MFRIHHILEEEDGIAIWKIEGEIREGQLDGWLEALDTLASAASAVGQSGKNGGQRLILDFCDVAHIAPEAAERLIERIGANIFLLNCPAAVKNMMHSVGLSRQVLG